MYDYYGGAMAHSPEVGRMPRAQRPVFESIAEQAARAPRHRGVRLLYPPLSSHDVHTAAGKDMLELSALGAGWAEPLRAFGVPVAFLRARRT